MRIDSDFELDTSEWLSLLIVLVVLILVLVFYSNLLFRRSAQLKKELKKVNSIFIAEKNQLRDAFFKSEEQLVEVLHSFPKGCFIQVNGEFALCNQVFCEYLGVKNSDELLGKNIVDFVHSDYQAEIKQRIHFLNDKRISFSVPMLSRFVPF